MANIFTLSTLNPLTMGLTLSLPLVLGLAVSPALIGCAQSVALEDQDGDGVIAAFDCNDLDPLIQSRYRDVDGDGFGVGSPTALCGHEGYLYAGKEGDCDDADHTVFPEAPELCDGIDNNCNYEADEGVLQPLAKSDNETLGDGIDSNCNGASDGITTIAGTGECCAAGDEGPASSSVIGNPAGLVLDGEGNLYIAQPEAHRIRRIAVNGIITTYAGTGVAGFGPDDDAIKVALNQPWGVSVDKDGVLYFSDSGNNRVCRVTTDGALTTIAGPSELGEDPPLALTDTLSDPRGIAVTRDGDVLIADRNHHRICSLESLASKKLSTIAGQFGVPGSGGDGDVGSDAYLNAPEGVMALDNGYTFIADTGNHRIRQLDTNGSIISTLVGNGAPGYGGDGAAATAAQLNHPTSIGMDTSNRLFIADRDNQRIRVVTLDDDIIHSAVGTGVLGYSGDGGTAREASLYLPSALTLDAQGNLYVSDYGNHRVRWVQW